MHARMPHTVKVFHEDIEDLIEVNWNQGSDPLLAKKRAFAVEKLKRLVVQREH